MGPAKNPRGMPIVALGLSAIDMLCCAMVSGLVMFLVLASPRAAAPLDGGRKGERHGISLQYQIETEGPVIALRFMTTGATIEPSVNFYSDLAKPMHFVADAGKRAALVLPSGTIQEHRQSVQSNDKAVARDMYFYNILQMRPVRWNILLTYADTDRAMASAIPETALVKVDVSEFGGSCNIHLECNVRVGGSTSLESNSCTPNPGQSCSLAKILEDIASARAPDESSTPGSLQKP